MDNQKASSSNSKEITGVQETPSVPPALMPDWLFRAAVDGIQELWESENEEPSSGDHLAMTMEASKAAPSQEIKKAAPAFLQSRALFRALFGAFFQAPWRFRTQCSKEAPGRGELMEAYKEEMKAAPDLLQSTTYMGSTILHILATYGHTELVNVICQKDGSMWRKQNKMLETPFHCAAKAGNHETISKLINFALNEKDNLKVVLRAKNKHGDTALHEAARRGYCSVVLELMAVDPILACEFNDDGASSLYLAAARETDNLMYQKILEKLSEHDINPVYSEGLNPKKLPESSLRSPVAEGDDITKTNPIHFLASAGKANVVKHLLESDPSLAYLQDSAGLFPVHLAAHTGNAEMVALFMNMFPDSVELLDGRGRNLFHIAAEEDVLDALFKLILRGLYVSPIDLQFAPAERVPLFFTDLVMNPTRKKSWPIGSENNFPSNTKEMLVRMINEIDNDGNTPLHLATENGCKSAIRIIYAIKTTAQTMKETKGKGSSISSLFKFADEYIPGYENIHLDLRNRKKLTPFDISVIQLQKSPESFQAMKERIQQYVNKHGACFTWGWFEHVMKINGANNMMNKLQLIGLGAVLITTITFAVAFTPPGGFDSHGYPVLGKKYFFKAFIIADTLAFILAALCVASIIYGGLISIDLSNNLWWFNITAPMILFSTALKYMMLAFGLGLYLMLAPVIKGVSIFILTFIVLSAVLELVMFLASLIFGKSSRFNGLADIAIIVSNGLFQYGTLFVFLFALLR